MAQQRNRWIVRNTRSEPAPCSCGMPILGFGEHSSWCDALRDPIAVRFLAGRDLEGWWWMPGPENAAVYAYNTARNLASRFRDQRGVTEAVREIHHDGPVAQRKERRCPIPTVAGSIPARPTEDGETSA